MAAARRARRPAAHPPGAPPTGTPSPGPFPDAPRLKGMAAYGRAIWVKSQDHRFKAERPKAKCKNYWNTGHEKSGSHALCYARAGPNGNSHCAL